jgi:hypothetical protein
MNIDLVTMGKFSSYSECASYFNTLDIMQKVTHIVLEIADIDKFITKLLRGNKISVTHCKHASARYLQLINLLSSHIKYPTSESEQFLSMCAEILLRLHRLTSEIIYAFGYKHILTSIHHYDVLELHSKHDCRIVLRMKVSTQNKKLLAHWLTTTLALEDISDEVVNNIYDKHCTASPKISKLLIVYALTDCNNINSNYVRRALNNLAAEKINNIKHHVISDTSYRNSYTYYLIILKALAKYGYNILCTDSENCYIRLCGMFAMGLINDHIGGKNRRAYKVYKLLNKIPQSELMRQDADFVAVMNHHLYAPDGQGAQNAALEFNELSNETI